MRAMRAISGKSQVKPLFFGADAQTRTEDLLITNQLLYQLSYISARDKGWQLYAPATAPANPSLPSPVLEGRFALFHERRHSLLLVFYAEARMKQPALEANALVERGLERPVDGLLGHHH